MSNLNKIYHKGYRNGEWAKHLRPFLKRVGNKKWRKTAKNLSEFEEEEVRTPKKRRLKKTIKVKITHKSYGEAIFTYTYKYRTMRDAKNAMNRASVITAKILEIK